MVKAVSQIEFEIKQIDRLFELYADLLERVQKGTPDLVDVTAVASMLHSFYIGKAQRLKQLLLRVAAGEPLEEVNEALGFTLDQHQLARCQAKYEAGGRRWEALIDGRQGHPRTAHSALREWLYARKEEDEEVRAPQLVIEIKEK